MGDLLPVRRVAKRPVESRLDMADESAQGTLNAEQGGRQGRGHRARGLSDVGQH